MSTKIVQVRPLTLSSSIGTSNTTTIVSGMVGLDGVDLTQADFGTIIYGTFEPNTEREEAVSFTITSNTAGVANINFTASGRGLIGKSPYGTGGIAHPHTSGVKLVISNNPNLFNKYTAKDNDETISNQWSFPTPTNPSSPATKQYADGLVALGGAEATDTARGISKLSASPSVAIGAVAITVATPAVFTFTAHGLISGDSIKLTTTGALPTGLLANTTYFVQTAGLTANAFRVSATLGGTDINTTGTQSGVHTLTRVTPIAVGYNDTTKLPTTAEKLAMAGGGDFGTPSGSNKFLTQSYIGARLIFGDGADGSVTISTPTTLTRDMYYSDLVVNDILTTNGFKIYVSGTISGSGTVQYPTPNNGAVGVGGNGGDGASAFTGVSYGLFLNTPGSGGGGAGSNGTSVGGAAGTGGNGAAFPGGGGASAAGFSGGNAASRLFGSINTPGGTGGQRTNTSGARGTGGGGGGGGASGGFVIIFAKTWAGTFTIKSVGGTGGAGAAGITGSGQTSLDTQPGGGGGTSTADASISKFTGYLENDSDLIHLNQGGTISIRRIQGAAGGGGGASGANAGSGGGGGGAGGHGGYGVVFHKTKTWTGTSDFTGGTGGTGGTGASQNGFNGSSGAVGSLYEINIG